MVGQATKKSKKLTGTKPGRNLPSKQLGQDRAKQLGQAESPPRVVHLVSGLSARDKAKATKATPRAELPACSPTHPARAHLAELKARPSSRPGHASPRRPRPQAPAALLPQATRMAAALVRLSRKLPACLSRTRTRPSWPPVPAQLASVRTHHPAHTILAHVSPELAASRSPLPHACLAPAAHAAQQPSKQLGQAELPCPHLVRASCLTRLAPHAALPVRVPHVSAKLPACLPTWPELALAPHVRAPRLARDPCLPRLAQRPSWLPALPRPCDQVTSSAVPSY